MKKSLSILLALLMLLYVFPMTAFAADAEVAQTGAEEELADAGITMISTANIVATEPYVGNHPNFNPSPGNSIFSIASVKWSSWETGSSVAMDASEVFLADVSYTLTMELVPSSGYQFSTSGSSSAVTVKVNDKKASVYTVSGYSPNYRIKVIKTYQSLEKEKINSISVKVNPPVVGEAPTFSATDTASAYDVYTSLNTSVYKNGVEWYDSTAGSAVATNGSVKFIAGHRYRVSVLVKANANYEFPTTTVTGKVNGNTGTVLSMYGYDKALYRTVEFEFSPVYAISKVSVTGVNEPIDGQNPVFSASLPAGAVYKVEPLTSGNWINGIIWKNETDGTIMTESDKFVNGKRYSVKVSLIVTNTDYTFDSTVNATINGNDADVTYYSGSVPNIGVTYTFTARYPTYIGFIEATGVTPPLPNAQPPYGATAPSGEGYDVASYNSGSTTINGIRWYNYTDAHAMEPSERFVSGKRYTVRVYLSRTSNVYRFVTSGLTGTVNGHAGSVGRVDSDMVWVEYTYTCKSRTTLSSVSVTVTAPVAGQAPVFSATVPSGAGYVVKTETNNTMWKNGVQWMGDGYFATDGSSGNFKGGKQYTVYVLLKPADEYYEFSSIVTGTVNGKSGTVYVAGSDPAHRYIKYTFPATEQQGSVVSGSVTSYLDASNPVIIKIVNKSNGAVVKSTTTTTGSYSITDVPNGSYILQASKTNHVDRDYTVTVSGVVTQDVKICPVGDVSGDGKITTKDYSMANAHAMKKSLLSGYALKCGDVLKNDGKISTADASRINAAAMKTQPLW